MTDAVTVPQTVFAPGSKVYRLLFTHSPNIWDRTPSIKMAIYMRRLLYQLICRMVLLRDCLQGTSPDGNELILYKNIYVYATETDLDGDGVANKDEPCLAVTPSHLDADRDGIDDACDGIIDETRDTTPPVVTAHVDVQPNDKGWYARDVTIHWTANDDTDTTIAPLADTTADQEGEYMYVAASV